MPELVEFQTIVILDLYDMTFDAVGVFGLIFFYKSGSSYCVLFSRKQNGSKLQSFLNTTYIFFQNLFFEKN